MSNVLKFELKKGWIVISPATNKILRKTGKKC